MNDGFQLWQPFNAGQHFFPDASAVSDDCGLFYL